MDLGINMKKTLTINGNKTEVKVLDLNQTNGVVSFEFEGKNYSFSRNSHRNNPSISLTDSLNNMNHNVVLCEDRAVVSGLDLSISTYKYQRSGAGGAEEGAMVSPMPGKILKVSVKVGDSVKKGDALIIMEAMKMEHTIKASSDGEITAVNCEEGSLVDGGLALVDIAQ
ncbi:MAG: acetyl-CoA carboxylase biotin carboxyl carrier protein subunit [Oligoflexia bacterium]|nr:acetyl-CoA carboxylase biotin carboxyl carrier protein subunit [Oligoflexia bacterium]